MGGKDCGDVLGSHRKGEKSMKNTRPFLFQTIS